MDIHQEIRQIRAFAERADREVKLLLACLNELEGRVLKDTYIQHSGRIRFKKGPRTILSILSRADKPMTRAQLLEVLVKDYQELSEDMGYAQRAVRNALQVLKKEGRVLCETPNGRLRETVWWASQVELEAMHKGEAANGGLGLNEHGRVK
jgi:DNA-binding transcriptional ArsR family regulator